jgi:hypothetical protein
MMWLLSSQWLSDGVLVVPWVEWLLEGMSVAWPWLGQQPEMRLMLLSGEGVGQGLRDWVSLGQGAGGPRQWVGQAAGDPEQQLPA